MAADRGKGERRGTAQAARAVALFLDALLPPGARRHPEVRGTPQRVAEAFAEELLDGYRQDPAAILAGGMARAGGELVAVTGIDFHAVCPHHLLPYRGVAHVGYVPGGRVVGFGQLPRLVDCFAHRLAIEEDVARHVAEALAEHLGARGAACLLEAEHLCLTVRGERRRGARAHAQCFRGVLETDRALQARFLALAAEAGPAAGREGARPRPAARWGGR